MRIILIILSLYSFSVFSLEKGRSLPGIKFGGFWSITKDGIKLHEPNLDISLSKGNGYYMYQEGTKPIVQVSTDKKDGSITYMESSDLYDQHILYKFDAQKKLLQYSECRDQYLSTTLCNHVNEKVCEKADEATSGINLFEDAAKCGKMKRQVADFNHFMDNRNAEEDGVLNKEINKLKDIPNKYKYAGEIKNLSSNIGSDSLVAKDRAMDKMYRLSIVLDRCAEFRQMGLLPSTKATSKNTRARSRANKQ